MRNFRIIAFVFALYIALPIAALAVPTVSAGPGPGGTSNTGAPTTSVTTSTATPEIPVGAAPIIVAGVLGAVMLVRGRRNKSKKN